MNNGTEQREINMANIGTAYVQIEPTAKGISGKIEQELGGMGASGGAAFSSGFAKVLGGTGKAIAGTVAIGAAAVTAMGGAFVNATGDVASYGDNIDKMSQKMGLSAQAYQEWDAVMQHSGTSMETMKASMKTLASAAETGKDAFDALGISQEQISQMSQEQLFEATISALQQVDDETQRTYLAGQVLGKGATELGALLNTSAEETQAMRDRVRELGGVMSDDAVKAAAAYQDQLQDMQTAFQGLSRNMLSQFLPAMTQVMGGLTDIFSGNTDEGLGKISEAINQLAEGLVQALPKVIEVAAQIIQGIAQAILENLPTLIPVAVEILMSFVDFFIQNLPMLIEAAAQLVLQLATGIADALPQLIPAIVQTILTIVQYLVENIDLLIDGAIQLMIGLAEGLIQALPILIEKIPEIIVALIEAIIRNAPLILEAIIQTAIMLVEGFVTAFAPIVQKAGEILSNMVNAVKTWLSQLPQTLAYYAGVAVAAFINFFTQLPAKLQQIWTNILNKVKEFGSFLAENGASMARDFAVRLINGLLQIPGKVVEIGRNIVEGLKQGIANAWGNLTEWVSGLASSLIQGFKDTLQIGSPSKVFRDDIGVWIPAGIAEGIEDGMSSIDTAMADMTAEMLPDQMSMVSSAAYTPTSGVQTSESQLYGLLARYLPVIAEGNNVNVSLEGNAQGLFNLMRQENKVYKRMSGQSAFA